MPPHILRDLLRFLAVVVGAMSAQPATLLAAPLQKPLVQEATSNVHRKDNHTPTPPPDSTATPANGLAYSTSIPSTLVNSGIRRTVLNPDYRVNAIMRVLLGPDYREVWTTPVDIPVIDLARTAGGLTPVRRGGGAQTRTLHLQGADGHPYVLRSLDKNAPGSLPEGFHDTIVADFAQDQVSSLNPFGALTLPTLARAAGIFHTTPAIVYIPDDPRLGTYRKDFAGMLALFERRPDEDQSDAPQFGYAKNVIGTEKLLEKLQDDNDERVDERAYARARLFDMLIGDWDRHKDQWRWAEFELPDDRKQYVPIPRDRDYVYVRYDGLINWARRLTHNIELRRLVNFKPQIRDLIGLNWQASHLDVRFTSSLTRDDWIEIADSLKQALTDEVIEEAFRIWPDTIYEVAAPRSISFLKSRRNQLPQIASRYYTILAREVDLVGSDKHERFEISRLGSGRTQVVIYKTKKEGDIVRELYRRTFSRQETREIRLFGLGGNDRFIVKGETETGSLIRIVGGDGADTFVDSSSVSGLKRLTRFYDTREGNTIIRGPDTRLFFSNDTLINQYALRKVEILSFEPIPALAYGSDDGLFIGGGVQITQAGFRKQPYAGRHRITLNYAPRSRAFNISYHGELIDIWHDWDANLTAEALAAYNFRNFYGLGNETPGTDEQRDRFLARIQTVSIEPSLSRYVRPRILFEFGPRFEFANVEPPKGRTENDPRSGFEPVDFVDRYYTGLQSALVLDTRAGGLNTQSGFLWANEARLNIGLRTVKENFVRLSSMLSYYYTLPLPTRITLALRVGGATNLGDFPFWQANSLGERSNLRGFPAGRFSGRSAVFTNAEVRAKLFDFNVYLTKGELGVFGFIDNGRVWADGEHSRIWHQGYGGGFWATPFDILILTAGIGVSNEHTLFSFSTGFLF